MSLIAATKVDCPGCGKSRPVNLVRNINAQVDPEQKQLLLKGELNVMVCECGKRTPLAADLLFHDPSSGFFCQVCVGDSSAIARSKKAFLDSGVVGSGRRIVRSMNVLTEKVKLLDEGLEDWAIEMVKVLLLASMDTPRIDEVLLFDSVDRTQGTLGWVLFATGEAAPRFLRSPLAPYERGVIRWKEVAPGDELEIDRAWAVAALRKVMPLPA
jgi:hypothetical protein